MISGRSWPCSGRTRLEPQRVTGAEGQPEPPAAGRSVRSQARRHQQERRAQANPSPVWRFSHQAAVPATSASIAERSTAAASARSSPHFGDVGPAAGTSMIGWCRDDVGPRPPTNALRPTVGVGRVGHDVEAVDAVGAGSHQTMMSSSTDVVGVEAGGWVYWARTRGLVVGRLLQRVKTRGPRPTAVPGGSSDTYAAPAANEGPRQVGHGMSQPELDHHAPRGECAPSAARCARAAQPHDIQRRARCSAPGPRRRRGNSSRCGRRPRP